jgi:hypothetical protein
MKPRWAPSRRRGVITPKRVVAWEKVGETVGDRPSVDEIVAQATAAT